jgi:uncharacterized protein (DUF433 family)
VELRQLDRITFDPAVMGGKPCIRGMRVTVGMIVGMVASGHDSDEILRLYPYLEPDDIRQALSYAAWRAEEVSSNRAAMRLLLDMNLSPAWVDFLEAEGWETVHWHAVGEPNAPDGEIMVWARDHGCYVVTNDLDFSAILAATRAEGPSVVRIRA